MATEDDNFDIDIYGDGGYNANDQADFKQEDTDLVLDVAESAPEPADSNMDSKQSESKQSAPETVTDSATEYPPQTHNPTDSTQSNTLVQAGGPQGVKRKDYEGRPHPDATTALLISDLQWWITDDAIRGWANEAECENELKDVTFNEHKVNGKSKGQVFVEFSTPTAAAATKDLIEGNHKFSIVFTNPHYNPYRTMPKDNPVRQGGRGGMTGNHNGGYTQNQNFGGGMNMGGYRGRGGYNNNNNRGMGMNNFGRGNYNSMGFQGGGGFQGGFQGPPMGNMPYNNFNRGAMMGGMRGGMRGRGGNMNPMGNNMGMGMNQMGGIGMNQMGGMAMNPMAGGMNPMMGGMGGGNMGMQGQGYQGTPNPAFNQNYFQGAPAAAGNAGDPSWNPHGAKRSRQE